MPITGEFLRTNTEPFVDLAETKGKLKRIDSNIVEVKIELDSRNHLNELKKKNKNSASFENAIISAAKKGKMERLFADSLPYGAHTSLANNTRYQTNNLTRAESTRSLYERKHRVPPSASA